MMSLLSKGLANYIYLRSLYRGKKLENRLDLDANSKYYVCSHGIGDVVWMSSYFNAYLEQCGVREQINIICMARDHNLIRQYLPEANFINLKKNDLLDFGRFVTSKWCKSSNLNALIYPHLKSPKKMRDEIEYMAEIGLDMDVCYKFGCFNLGHDAIFQSPNMNLFEKEAEDFIQENKIERGATVILVPYINSRLGLHIDDWTKIAIELRNMGCNVYTNIGTNADQIIPGTLPLQTSLEILPLVIIKTGCVVSGRCGLADWLFVNGCNLSLIHTLKKGSNLSPNEMIQSMFAKKESFLEMKHRCNINSELKEYRFSQNSSNDALISQLVHETTQMLDGIE